jgi:hypothetical protein
MWTIHKTTAISDSHDSQPYRLSGCKSRDIQELAEMYLTMLVHRLSQLRLKLPKLSTTYPHHAI